MKENDEKIINPLGWKLKKNNLGKSQGMRRKGKGMHKEEQRVEPKLGEPLKRRLPTLDKRLDMRRKQDQFVSKLEESAKWKSNNAY